jgi:hypothetical protein
LCQALLQEGVTDSNRVFHLQSSFRIHGCLLQLEVFAAGSSLLFIPEDAI